MHRYCCWAKPAPARRCWRAQSMPPAVAPAGRLSPSIAARCRVTWWRAIFSAASGGTVFLDELGEMPKDVQVKLLRVLQEKELRPVGGTRAVPVDVRIMAASNRSLGELRSTLLREDLYFRIATIVVEVPPLRSRPEDILVLSQHFAARLSRRYGREIS